MIKIMSNRDKMVGMKSMLSSPFVSSQRPNTEFAAASTEQREFRVVVIPALRLQTRSTWYYDGHGVCKQTKKALRRFYLCNRDGLLLHGFMDCNSVIFSHLFENKRQSLQSLKASDHTSKLAFQTPTLSNSSMQTTPPSASTMAPPSITNPRVCGSRRTEAVRPAALLPLPEV